MPKHNGAHPRPTPYPDLNAFLAEWLAGVREALGDDLVGAYLHGSFAIGDFDRHSDVDFLAVIERDLEAIEVEALRALHARLHASPNPWATRLEGSYAPRALIRRRTAEPRDPPGEPRGPDWEDPEQAGGLGPSVYPFWFNGNGNDHVRRSEHDNRIIPRWILRERGVVLAGPSPRGLIDPVPADDVRGEVRELLDIFVKAADELLRARIFQAFTAVATARALHSLDTGRVQSKKAAVAFAKHRLEPRFAGLVERGFAERDERPATDAEMQAYVEIRADPAEAALTLEFLRYAQAGGPPHISDLRTTIERQLALKRQSPPDRGWRGGPPDRGGRPGGRGGWTPPPNRPGGRRGRG